jgi:hypothetical protein
LHTENQLPRLPGSALKVPGWWWGGGWVASYPLLSQAPTPVEVELGCDNKFVGLLLFFLSCLPFFIYTHTFACPYDNPFLDNSNRTQTWLIIIYLLFIYSVNIKPPITKSLAFAWGWQKIKKYMDIAQCNEYYVYPCKGQYQR